MNPRFRDLVILSGICFLCFFWRLGSVGLFDFNEGFYTQVAREMYLRGDFISPRVNGIYFFDKPPLAIWLSALSFHLFGVNEFAARLPVALAAAAIVFLTYGFGARYFDRRAGLFAGAMVALNPLFYGTARQMTMDIHQTLWFAVAMFSFFLAHAETSETQGVRRETWQPLTPHASRLTPLYYHLFWAACGLGALAKSVPGLFPIGAAFVFVVVTERFRWRAVLQRIREARILTGFPLMLAIIVPWFFLAWRANGHVFYEEFWLLHHVQLASGGDFSHAQPIWYYVPALIGGFFPWSLFLPWTVSSTHPPAPSRDGRGSIGEVAWSERVERPNDLTTHGSPAPSYPTTQRPNGPAAHLFILAWAGFVFVVFSVMKSKLVSYLLPMYPAAALLAGNWMARAIEARQERGLRWGAALAAGISVAGLAVGSVVVHHIITSPGAARQRQDVPPDVLQFGIHALILVALGMCISALLIWSGRRGQGSWTLVATAAVFVTFADVEGLNVMEAKMNAPLQSLASDAGSRLSAGVPIAIHIGQPRRPSVFFYLPDSVYIGKPLPAQGEEGLILERGERAPIDAFLQRNRPAYILTDRKRADALLSNTASLSLVEQRDHWVLLRAEPLPESIAAEPGSSSTAPRGH